MQPTRKGILHNLSLQTLAVSTLFLLFWSPRVTAGAVSSALVARQQNNRKSSMQPARKGLIRNLLFVSTLFLLFLSPAVTAGATSSRAVTRQDNRRKVVPTVKKVKTFCPHCKSWLHTGGKAECPWKSLSTQMAQVEAKTKIKLGEHFMYGRISIETILGLIFIYLGEVRGKNREIVVGAALLGASLFEISHFIGGNGPKVCGAAILFTAFLLAIQNM
mmetsp:Transcript_31018/g.47309  ORF Transcript_31018/g.47309 Transcript_31018/m.47309 type:complete len:218 (+) Transcript_31018:55-708(+)